MSKENEVVETEETTNEDFGKSRTKASKFLVLIAAIIFAAGVVYCEVNDVPGPTTEEIRKFAEEKGFPGF